MKYLLFLFLFSFGVSGLAQSKFGLRKTYDGSSKDENKPASLSLNRDFEDDKTFYTLDLGIKFTELEILPKSNQILTLLPKGEYHIDKRDTFKINTISGGVNLQYQPSANNSPWVLGSVDYQGDFVKDTEVLKVKAYVSFLSTKGIKPCFNIRNKNGNLIFRYFPYIGYERYKSMVKEKDGTASFVAARLYFELIPFPAKNPANIYFQIVLDFSCRWKIDDSLYENKNLAWIAPSLVYYPSGQDKFGIGLDYSAGYDPVSNFSKVNRLTLSFKVKI